MLGQKLFYSEFWKCYSIFWHLWLSVRASMMFSFLFPSSDPFSSLWKPFTPGFLQFQWHDVVPLPLVYGGPLQPFHSNNPNPSVLGNFLLLLISLNLCFLSPLWNSSYLDVGFLEWFSYFCLFLYYLLPCWCLFVRIFLVFVSFFFVLIYSFCWLISFLTLSVLCSGVGEIVIWLYEGEF